MYMLPVHLLTKTKLNFKLKRTPLKKKGKRKKKKGIEKKKHKGIEREQIDVFGIRATYIIFHKFFVTNIYLSRSLSL